MARVRHKAEDVCVLGSLFYNGEIRRFSYLGEGFAGGSSLGELILCSFLCRAYLVPSYSFGENEVHNQEIFPEGTWIRFFQKTFQATFKKILGLNFCTFHGRGLTQESWGFLPFNRPITTVGKLSNTSGPPLLLIPPTQVIHQVQEAQQTAGMGSGNSKGYD